MKGKIYEKVKLYFLLVINMNFVSAVEEGHGFIIYENKTPRRN
jgi:hypothetical protein